MLFWKYLYKLGVGIRNNDIPKNFNFLLKSQYWDLARLEAHQADLLKKLIFQAYHKSPFYRERMDKKELTPDDIHNTDDLKKLPPLTKEEILNNVERIQIRDNTEKLFYSETSGSTGKPLVFYRNKDWDAWHRASVFRGYSWYDVNPWDRNGYLWGYNFALKRRMKTMFLDFLQNRFRLFSYKDDEIEKFADKLQDAVFLGGYSSMIYEIAKIVNKRKPKPAFSLKMVKGTSEKIYEKYQAEAQQVFGRKIISEYGAAETGIIAFECPDGNMHINMETAIVEEENNEIIVTNIVSRSFPIIRYRLGDYVEIDEATQCPCGRQHPIIKEVTGRVGKVIYGKSDIYPSLTLYYMFKNLAMEHDVVLNYQAIQKTKGAMDLNIEDALSSTHRKLLINEIQKYFKDDLIVSIQERADLKSENRKKRDFISEF